MTTRAKELERETEFVQRSTAQLDGPIFAQTTVFGWMDTPEASYPQLRHVAAGLGVSVSSHAAPNSDGNLRQVAGLSDHALAHAYRVLVGTQSQHG